MFPSPVGLQLHFMLLSTKGHTKQHTSTLKRAAGTRTRQDTTDPIKMLSSLKERLSSFYHSRFMLVAGVL